MHGIQPKRVVSSSSPRRSARPPYRTAPVPPPPTKGVSCFIVKLRTYEPSDLPHLAEVWNDCFSGGPNFVRLDEADLRRRVIEQPSFDPTCLLVAGHGAQVLGFAHFGPRTNLWTRPADRRVDREEGHIYVVVADPSDRPLLRDLLAAAAERLTEAGARRLLLGPSWVYGTQPFYNGIAGAYETPGLSAARGDLLELAGESGFAPLAEYGTPELHLSDGGHLTALRERASRLWERSGESELRGRARPLPSPFFPGRNSVELVRGHGVVAAAAYGPWPEYAREHGRSLFGITSVQVAPGWRGRGLAKLIVIQALEAALKAGAEALHLHVWRGNKPAWNLYHRALGFRPRFTWLTLAKQLD